MGQNICSPSDKALEYKNPWWIRNQFSNAPPLLLHRKRFFYGSNKPSILLSIPFIIRDEDDELLPSSACSSSFEGLEAIFPEFSPC